MKALVKLIERNSTVSATNGQRQQIAQSLARLLVGLARTIPMRQLEMGEAAAIRRDGKIHWFGHETQFVSRYSVHGKDFMARFEHSVKEAANGKALVFHLAPIMEFPPEGPVLWLNAHVVGRRDALCLGNSFNRKVRSGPKKWWRDARP